MSVSSSLCSLLLLLLLMLSFAASGKAQQSFPAPVSGLAYGFYNTSCPNAESTVQQMIQSVLSSNVSEAAGVIRLFFHDCFVQGCDASLMINATNGELNVAPNLTIRPSARQIIEQIKSSLESACPNTVSCSDILALAAREAVNQTGGGFYPVPTGRRDGLNFANSSTVLANIPAPTDNITKLNSTFSSKNLDLTDLTALSGAHTIGLAHCSSFNSSLFPTPASRYNTTFAQTLLQTCPTSTSNNITNMDLVTPNIFDNQYYNNVLSGSVDFDSDDALLRNSVTQSTVQSFASNQTLFLSQFSIAMIKMSMIQVLTGSAGNIRSVCSVFNNGSSSSSSIIQEVESSERVRAA